MSLRANLKTLHVRTIKRLVVFHTRVTGASPAITDVTMRVNMSTPIQQQQQNLTRYNHEKTRTISATAGRWCGITARGTSLEGAAR